MDVFEIVVITPDVTIAIENTDNTTKFESTENQSEYILKLGAQYNDKELWECLAAFISYFFCRNSMTKESIKTLLENKQSGEKLMDRVSNLTYVKQSITNVLGESFKCKIEDWSKTDDKFYPMINKSFIHTPQQYKNEKQTDMTFHRINRDMSVWDGAGWQGCGFVFDQLGTTPPIFGLAFENIERGKRIIEEWRNLVQANKPAVILYIVKGIDKNHPTWYRVCVAPVVERKDLKEGRYYTTMCRKHTMTPNSTVNLDNFEKLYNRFKGCWFTAFAMEPERHIIMPANFDDAFRFDKIEIRNAWEIGTHDLAKTALEHDDDPFIPEDKKDSAPINEVLKEFRDIETKPHH